MVALKYYVPGDLVALDEDDQPVALIEVRAEPHAPASAEAALAAAASGSPVPMPYAMLVDLSDIRIFQVEADKTLRPLLCLPTPDTLRLYEPEFDTLEIYDNYLIGLTDVWLRDIFYRWKSQNPPGLSALESIGLAQRLGRGNTIVGGDSPQ